MNVLVFKRIITIVLAMIALLVLQVVCFKVKKTLISKTQKRMMKGIWGLGTIIVLLMMVSYLFADTVLYRPHFQEEAYAQLKNSENLEELLIDTPVGKCAGWMYHSMYESQVTIILFPGNMYTSEEMAGYSSGLEQKETGINMITLDYPGYGRSEGMPTEHTIKQMALSAFDELMCRSDMQNQKIVLMGYSLGTGIANYVASKREIDGLILMAPYQNGYDLLNGFVDVYHGPLKLLNPYKMRADKFAETIRVKPLLIASRDDELISYKSSLALSEIYPAGCEVKLYDGLGHGGFWQDMNVKQDILGYLTDNFSK